MFKDDLKMKIIVLIISLILSGLIVALFFLDTSLNWNFVKIISCIVVVLWGFFVAPTIKYIINWFNSLSNEQALYQGFKIGYYGIVILLLMAPVIGIMYYLDKKLTKKNAIYYILVGWYNL